MPSAVAPFGPARKSGTRRRQRFDDVVVRLTLFERLGERDDSRAGCFERPKSAVARSVPTRSGRPTRARPAPAGTARARRSARIVSDSRRTSRALTSRLQPRRRSGATTRTADAKIRASRIGLESACRSCRPPRASDPAGCRSRRASRRGRDCPEPLPRASGRRRPTGRRRYTPACSRHRAVLPVRLLLHELRQHRDRLVVVLSRDVQTGQHRAKIGVGLRTRDPRSPARDARCPLVRFSCVRAAAATCAGERRGHATRRWFRGHDALRGSSGSIFSACSAAAIASSRDSDACRGWRDRTRCRQRAGSSVIARL